MVDKNLPAEKVEYTESTESNYSEYDLAIGFAHIADLGACAHEALKSGTHKERLQILHLMDCVFYENAVAKCEGKKPPSQTAIYQLFTATYDCSDKYFREHWIPRCLQLGLIEKTSGSGRCQHITLREQGREALEAFRFFIRQSALERATLYANAPSPISPKRIRELRGRFKDRVSYDPEGMLDAAERGEMLNFINEYATS